ncbi:phosphatidylinositol-specific phospholipase C domain-containing protein [Streptomyces sp. NPDC079020]|uniref:phosphatidylinositol-specific phospholipase C domain-containing protein n=1 Tax=Streptomyces sp. NPDC079020 TaxID=3365722 RepID=UPI0037CEB183
MRHHSVARAGWRRIAALFATFIVMVGILAALSPGTAWALEDDTDNPAYRSLGRANNPDWMRGVGDNTPLGWMSVPGTHESLSIRGGDSTYTQQNGGASGGTLAAQLQAGIRSIDIRVRVIGGSFTIHHGVVYQDANFADVLRVLGDFLSAHPSETVMMHLRAECDNSSNAITDCNDEPDSTTDQGRVDTFRKYLTDDPNAQYEVPPSLGSR